MSNRCVYFQVKPAMFGSLFVMFLTYTPLGHGLYMYREWFIYIYLQNRMFCERYIIIVIAWFQAFPDMHMRYHCARV